MNQKIIILSVILAFSLSISESHSEELNIKEWEIPTSDSAPHDVVVGPDGIIWFTEIATNKIGKFDPNTEQFSEYIIPTESSRPHGLVVDNQGNVWFTEVGAGQIGMFNPVSETFEEFATPTPNSGPHTPIFADNTTLWFTEQRASKIGKLDTVTKTIEEFTTITSSANPYGIITDEQGNAWFAELQGHHIGKVDAQTGHVTEYSPLTDQSGPRRIAIDSNGMLWFTQYNVGKISKFDPTTETMTEFDTSSESSGPYAIWVDPFDNVWFSMTGIYKVGKFDQSTETLHEYELPSPQTHIKFIHTDSKGNIWYPNYNNNKIGVIFASQPTNQVITQQELKTMVENWMNNPDDDDTNQRLEIMKAYYAFEETGGKLSHDQEGLVLMNQIRKMVSIQIPVEELDELRKQVRVELGLEIPSENKILYVDSMLVDCVGVGPQKCMKVREDPSSSWQNFYDSIKGFDYTEGKSYKISVKVTDVKNPPADASSKKYELIEILDKKSYSKHIPYKNICAPGYVSLGSICVLNDRCGPGIYPGKVCVMDGVKQPYLRPSQQGNAGIAAGDVICAENLNLVFKSHDGSPACVNDDSISKLQERGWQTVMPNLACTLEYNPMCGMDEISYGNPCMLKSSHVALKHFGECTIPMEETSGIFEKTLEYTTQPAVIDSEQGYFVTEIANGVFWLVGSGYQTMFVTTGEGVVAFDAPRPIGEKYLQAITDVTSEPITHMIYSHHHQDHTGAAGEIFSKDITFISHKDAADALVAENNPVIPIPTEILEGDVNSLQIGSKTFEFYDLGAFHSKGNWLILIPDSKVAMLVDLFRPAESPYRSFGVTPDIELYLETHDVVQTFDFDVIITGHTNLLATKEHVAVNKQFTQSVMDNAQIALDSGESNPFELCTIMTIEQWTGKIGNLDTFMNDHCTAMIEYLQSK